MATSTRSVLARNDRERPPPTDPGKFGSPLFLLNLKSYPSSVGPGAVRVGALLERLSARHGVAAVLAPAMVDVARLAELLSIPVIAQHADPVESGARTGWVAPEALKRSGAQGSLINHSERRLPAREIRSVVRLMNQWSLTTVICAKNVAEARRLADLRPPFLAVEPPELIGGTISVAKARPEVIADTVRAVHLVSPTTHVLCGAGIQDGADVRRALELGSDGILVASAVTRAPDPERALNELLAGF